MKTYNKIVAVVLSAVLMSTGVNSVYAVENIMFSDDFSEYSDANAITQKMTSVHETGTVEGWKLDRGRAILAEGKTDDNFVYRWILSDKLKGDTSNKDVRAYIDTQNKNIRVKSTGGSYGALSLLDIGKIDDITKIEATVIPENYTNSVLAFVNKDEDKYIRFELHGYEAEKTVNALPAVYVKNGSTTTNVALGVYGQIEYTTKGTNCESNYTGNWTYKTVRENPVKWTIDVTATGINWSCVSDAGPAASGTIPISLVTPLLDDMEYPLGVVTRGPNTSSFDDIAVYGTRSSENESAYYDDFTFYRNDVADSGVYKNAVTESDKTLGMANSVADAETEFVGHRMESGAKALNTGAKATFSNDVGPQWITSEIYTGTYGSTGSDGRQIEYYPGKAYIDTTADALAVFGGGAYNPASVNLDIGDDARVKNFTRAKFTLGKPSINDSIRLFVSGNEAKFLEFGFTGLNSNVYGNATYQTTPYIRKGLTAPAFSDKGFQTANGSSSKVEYFIYDGSSFSQLTTDGYGIERTPADTENYVQPATSKNCTVTTDVAWTSANTEITYDISVNNETGIVTWEAKGDVAGHSIGEINDEDVKAIVKSMWAYPVAFASAGGTNGGRLYEIELWYDERPFDADTEYEDKAYTHRELFDMYVAAQDGKIEDVHAVMKIDTSECTNDTATAEFTVTNVEKNSVNMLGSQYEFTDNAEQFYDIDTMQLKSEYVSFAEKQAPIPSLRIGGSASSLVNMLSSWNGEPSYYTQDVIDRDIISATPDGNGKYPAKSAYKMGIPEVIKAMWANNRDMSFVFCVSPYTTTPEDIAEFVRLLISEEEDAKEERIAKLGSAEPVNVHAIELGNEIDHGATPGSDIFNEKVDWYRNWAMKTIDELEKSNLDVKVMGCGVTGPWGLGADNTEWLKGVFLKKIGLSNGSYIEDESGTTLASKIDLISYHPYYDGIPTEGLLQYTDTWYNALVQENPDIKISYTEYGRNWDKEYGSAHTSNLNGALASIYFISEALEKPYSDSAYAHNLNGSALWSRWQYDSKVQCFGENPLATMFNTVTESWGNKAYESALGITADKLDYFYGANNDSDSTNNIPTSRRFNATAVKVDDNTVNLIFTNNQGYTEVDVDIVLPEEFENYRLSGEKIMTAPNLFSYMSDYAMNGIAKTTEKTFDIPKAVPDKYLVPTKSLVVLTLTKDIISYDKNDSTGKVTIKVNPDVYEKAFTFIAAYYTDRLLDNLITKSYTATSEADTFSIDAAKDDQVIKLMIWDSLIDMHPITSVITIK